MRQNFFHWNALDKVLLRKSCCGFFLSKIFWNLGWFGLVVQFRIHEFLVFLKLFWIVFNLRTPNLLTIKSAARVRRIFWPFTYNYFKQSFNFLSLFEIVVEGQNLRPTLVHLYKSMNVPKLAVLDFSLEFRLLKMAQIML